MASAATLAVARKALPVPPGSWSARTDTRGWGKAATYEPQRGDPFDWGNVEQAAVRAKILQLARDPEPDATL